MSTDDARDLILVVDDTETSRYRTSRVLRRAGFEIAEASRGEEALRFIRDHAPRLVVLDVNIPDVDGWEVCRRIKADPTTASVLVLQLSASYVTEADTVRALDGGADGCLTEPVEPPVLVATVRALLRARRAEESLRAALAGEQAAREAAEAANHAKDQFLAVLSHELRSPLQGVVGWAHLLRQGRLDEAGQKHALEVIDRSLRQQVALVNDLLDVSRIVAGKLGIERHPVDLAAVVGSVLEDHELAAKGRHIRLERPADLPAGEATVVGDRGRLHQVVGNLVGNAIKFTPDGGQIVTRIACDGDVVVTVNDTGEGIDAALLPHVFDAFRQADSSNLRRQGGLGLGLALVRSIVEMHGGTVSAASPGRTHGSTFTVRLPRAQRAIVLTGPSTKPTPVRLEGVRVLVVEDDADARSALRVVLELAGAETRVAGSADEAMAVMRADPADVVVSDIAMPDQDGYALVEKLRLLDRAGGRPLLAIALTGHASGIDRERALLAGFDAHVGKPIEPDVLVRSVASLVAERLELGG
jgi:signal transduction histidine kinase